MALAPFLGMSPSRRVAPATPRKLRILVAVDFSEDSRRALDQAVAWALRAPSDLVLLHVVESGTVSVTSELAHHFEALERLAAGARPADDSLGEPRRHVAAGDPATEILRLASARKMDLIFLGTHGRSGLGSVAEKVVRHATCPVLCVGRSTALPGRWQHLICPVDFSETSRRAMRSAIELARELDAELLLLHAVQLRAGAAKLNDERRRAAEAELERWQNEAAAGGVRASAAVVFGEPGDEIVRLARARSCGAIVMGTHGRTGLAHLLMGSVAERVVRTAACPVLTVALADPHCVDERHAGPPAG